MNNREIISVKITYHEEIRRFSLAPRTTLPELQELLQRTFEATKLNMDSAIIEYVDEEGDFIRVGSELEWNHALENIQRIGQTVLRMRLHDEKNEKPRRKQKEIQWVIVPDSQKKKKKKTQSKKLQQQKPGDEEEEEVTVLSAEPSSSPASSASVTTTTTEAKPIAVSSSASAILDSIMKGVQDAVDKVRIEQAFEKIVNTAMQTTNSVQKHVQQAWKDLNNAAVGTTSSLASSSQSAAPVDTLLLDDSLLSSLPLPAEEVALQLQSLQLPAETIIPDHEAQQPSAPVAPQESEKYNAEIEFLKMMGFDDTNRNKQLLEQFNGEVEKVVDELLSSS